MVCEFHNLSEGHVTYFCKDVIKGMLAEQASRKLLSWWKDRTIWRERLTSIPPFPGTSLGQMSGHDKEVVGQHADILMYRLFYDCAEKELWRLFRQGERNALACRLMSETMDDKGGWRADDWKTYYDAVPWRNFFLMYIVPLAQMMRGLTSVYQSRETLQEGGVLDSWIKKYIIGCRVVMGEDFLRRKGIFHRLRHLTQQALGKFTI